MLRFSDWLSRIKGATIGEQTPDELEMGDGDEIDAMLNQTDRLSEKGSSSFVFKLVVFDSRKKWNPGDIRENRVGKILFYY
ncbi:hypothetical protein IFM89_020496 [Coptis chinensis]|uniref:Uncharacterized protein n=1 Tax=Coptis chinensis TaxID=261450 RepID=A0A835LFW6_9MAGN|nr:hypothetical protein IFM89_020496 [Coptis chinensis]